MKLLPIFLLLLIPASSAYPLRNLSNNSIYSNESIIVNVTYPDNTTSIVEIIPTCFNVTSPLNFTMFDTIGYDFNNSTNFSYTITPNTCNYGHQLITGVYSLNGSESITSDPTYITYYSPYINLYKKYDTNNNKLISKDEVLKSVLDYFNNLLSYNNVTKITDKYLTQTILT